ncbi:MAG: hypothetical protein ACE366_03140 [Bradymonadia bacterium]
MAPLIWLPGQATAGMPRLWWLLAWGPLWLGVALVPPKGHRWPAVCWLLWAGAAAVSALWVAHPGAAIEGALQRLSLAVGLMGGLAAGHRLSSLGHGLALISGSLAALTQLLDPAGSFGNPDFLAGWLALCLVWSATGLRGAPWQGVLLSGLGMSLMLVGLWRAGSLGAWAAVAMGTPLALCPLRRRGPLLLIMVVLAGLLIWLAPEDDLSGLSDHIAGRLHVFEIAWQIHGGAFGVGAGGFHRAFLEAQAGYAGPWWTNAYHGHNALLHTWVEQGLIGVCLLAAPVGAALLKLHRHPLSVVVCAAVVWSLVNPTLPAAGLGWLAGLAVGLTLSREGPAQKAERPSGILNPHLRWLWAPVALVCTAQLITDRWLTRPEPPALTATLSLRAERPWRLHAQRLLDTDPEAAWRLATDAVALEPSVPGWALVGATASASNRPEAAIAAYGEAVRLQPRLFAGHYNLSRLYEARGERAAARRHAARARSLRPSDPRLRDLVPSSAR